MLVLVILGDCGCKLDDWIWCCEFKLLLLSSQHSNEDQENSFNSNQNRLSPANARTAASVLAAIAAVSSSATKSTIDISNSTNNNNLLSPGKAYFINSSSSQHQKQQQQDMLLKYMQKKYSKSMDTSYLGSSNSLARTPNSNSSSRNNLDQTEPQANQIQVKLI